MFRRITAPGRVQGVRRRVPRSVVARAVRRRRPLQIEALESRNLLSVDPRYILISDDLGETTWVTLGSVSLPSFTYVQGPAGVSAPGEAFDPFSAGITFNNVPAAAAPDIVEWTRTAGPDESIAVVGADFSSYLGGATRFYVFADYGPGPGWILSATTQSTEGDNRAVVTLPGADLPANAMYLMWAANDDGVSRPVAVNQTEAWWIGPNHGQAGQKISIYGRNLSQNGGEWVLGSSTGPAPAWVWIAPSGGGAAIAARVTAVDPYRVEFEIPVGLAAGSYKAWVHNGRGGEYGWGAPLEFVVRLARNNTTAWPGPVFNASNTPLLAQMLTNPAGADDGALLQQVLNTAGQAQNAYSTVVLPSGVFTIASRLTVPSNVRLVGLGMNATVLKAIPGENFANNPLLYSANMAWTSRNTLIEKLTLHSGYNPLGAADAAYTGGIATLARLNGQSDVRFYQVRFETRAGKALHLTDCERIRIENCEFYVNQAIFAEGCKQTFVDKCTIYLTNFSSTAIYVVRNQQMSVTNSTARSESTAEAHRTAKWGLRLFVGAQDGRHEYLARNTTSQLGLPPGSSAHLGEQILWEGSNPEFMASPLNSTASTVTFNKPANSTNLGNGQYSIVVVQGRGLGQTRRIVSQSSTASTTTLTLEAPLDVSLDATSRVQVLMMKQRSVVYGNSLNGIVENATRPTSNGSAGIMFFGGVTDMIVERNTLTNIRLPISIWSLTRVANGVPMFEPAMFSFVANNTVNQGRFGVVVYAAYTFTPQTDPTSREASPLAGTVVRANTVQNGLVSGFDVVFIRQSADQPTSQVVDALVLEHNRFVNLPVAINFSFAMMTNYQGFTTSGAVVRNALVYKNYLQHKSSATATPSAGSKGIVVGPDQSVDLKANGIVGFETPYADSVPITVRPTGVPNQYAFTMTGRDVDRSGAEFVYRVDWDANGVWDEIVPGSTTVLAGGAYTVVRTFASTSPVAPRFQIRLGAGGANYNWNVPLDLGRSQPRAPFSPISAVLVVGPTATSREFTFTLAANNLLGSGAMIFSIDWNGDGDFEDADESKVAVGAATWTHRFSAGGSRTIRYRVVDEAGNAFESALTLDPNQRIVHFVGSNREDWATFREPSLGRVVVDVRRLGGRQSSISLTFNSAAGVAAYGNDGADWIDASGLTTRPATIWGGAGADSLVGGAGDDVIYGGAPAGLMLTADAPNAIAGGAGNNAIYAGTASDVVAGAADVFAFESPEVDGEFSDDAIRLFADAPAASSGRVDSPTASHESRLFHTALEMGRLPADAVFSAVSSIPQPVGVEVASGSLLQESVQAEIECGRRDGCGPASDDRRADEAASVDEVLAALGEFTSSGPEAFTPEWETSTGADWGEALDDDGVFEASFLTEPWPAP